MNNIFSRIQDRIELLPMRIKFSVKSNEIIKSMKEDTDFSSSDLAEIADLLSTSFHWLLTGERDPEEVRLSARHSYDKETKSHNHDWAMTVKVMENPILSYRQSDIEGCRKYPVLKEYSAVNAARVIREKLIKDYGYHFVNNFPDAIEKVFGIDVFIIKSSENFDACAGTYKENSFIVVKESGAWYRTNFSFAHELGHLIKDDLTDATEIDQTDHSDNERWANAFASELLMPQALLKTISWTELPDEQLAYYIWEWGISTEALSRKLEKLQLSNLALGVKLYVSTVDILEEYIESSDILAKNQLYKKERFPQRLIDEHHKLFKRGITNGEILSWFLDVPLDDLLLNENTPDEEFSDGTFFGMGY